MTGELKARKARKAVGFYISKSKNEKLLKSPVGIEGLVLSVLLDTEREIQNQDEGKRGIYHCSIHVHSLSLTLSTPIHT